MKINSKRELQNIAINDSVDIIKILLKFTENVQKNHIIFLTIDTTLSSSNALRFRKNLLTVYKK